jgi:hypothetical protein
MVKAATRADRHVWTRRGAIALPNDVRTRSSNPFNVAPLASIAPAIAQPVARHRPGCDSKGLAHARQTPDMRNDHGNSSVNTGHENVPSVLKVESVTHIVPNEHALQSAVVQLKRTRTTVDVADAAESLGDEGDPDAALSRGFSSHGVDWRVPLGMRRPLLPVEPPDNSVKSLKARLTATRAPIRTTRLV